MNQSPSRQAAPPNAGAGEESAESVGAESVFDLFGDAAAVLLHAAHDSIVIVDEQHRVVALNPAAQRLLRCNLEESLGQSLDRFLPPRYRAAHAGQVHRFGNDSAQERRMAARRKVTALRADGQEIPVEIMLSRVDLVDASGPRRYLAALMRDLSEVRALQAELDRSRSRVRAVFELSPVALWIADNGRVIFANGAAARLFNAANGEALLGRSIFDLVAPPEHDTLRQRMTQVLGDKGAVARFESHLVDADGEQRDFEIALAALPEHGRTTVQLVVSDVTQHRRAALEVERSHQLLRELSANAVEAREAERRRIARELHDELGQHLTALKMDLAGLAGNAAPAVRKARLQEMLSLLDETMTSLRRIAADLRPLMLDDLGLSAAIEWLAMDASRRLGIAIDVRVGALEPTLDERIAIAVYRMVQEALTNVSRHARATRVEVALNQLGSDLVLSVHDNGIGFPVQALQRPGSYGLLGMRERAAMLGGRLEIDNPADGGGRLTVHLPLSQSAPSAPPLPS
jgi:two-component system, NarL family, sensor histidine kinase UhpB